MSYADAFNRTGFSRWLNRPAGRLFRVTAGVAFLAAGAALGRQPLGVAAIAWGILPLTAGAFDVCYISAALRGPLRGRVIRSRQGPALGTA